MYNLLKKEYIISGLVGAISVIALILIILPLLGTFNFQSTYILNSTATDVTFFFFFFKCLKRMEESGFLLTPNDYTNNVVNFYNALLTGIGIVFIIFSVISFIIIRDNNSKETRKAVREFLNDSKTFKDEVTNSLIGEFDEIFVHKEEYSNDFKAIDERLHSVENQNQNIEIE